MNFGTIKALQRHKRCCYSRMGQVLGEEETRIRPTRIAARWQGQLLREIAMHQLEWHTIDSVDTSGLDVDDMHEEACLMFQIQFRLKGEQQRLEQQKVNVND